MVLMVELSSDPAVDLVGRFCQMPSLQNSWWGDTPLEKKDSSIVSWTRWTRMMLYLSINKNATMRRKASYVACSR